MNTPESFATFVVVAMFIAFARSVVFARCDAFARCVAFAGCRAWRAARAGRLVPRTGAQAVSASVSASVSAAAFMGGVSAGRLVILRQSAAKIMWGDRVGQARWFCSVGLLRRFDQLALDPSQKDADDLGDFGDPQQTGTQKVDEGPDDPDHADIDQCPDLGSTG